MVFSGLALVTDSAVFKCARCFPRYLKHCPKEVKPNGKGEVINKGSRNAWRIGKDRQKKVRKIHRSNQTLVQHSASPLMCDFIEASGATQVLCWLGAWDGMYASCPKISSSIRAKLIAVMHQTTKISLQGKMSPYSISPKSKLCTLSHSPLRSNQLSVHGLQDTWV